MGHYFLDIQQEYFVPKASIGPLRTGQLNGHLLIFEPINPIPTDSEFSLNKAAKFDL